MWRNLLIAVVVVIIVLVLVVAPRVRDSERELAGFWVGESEFLKKAGLSDINLYIAPGAAQDGKTTRQGHLLMVDIDGEIVTNQGVEMTYTDVAGRWRSALAAHCASGNDRPSYTIANVKLAFDDGGSIMPAVVDLRMCEGMLAICDSEKIHAYLVRDNDTSLRANDEYTTNSSPTAS